MPDPLITVAQLEARLAESFSGVGLAQVEALLDDASALVRQVARTDFDNGVPGVIVAVTAQMVRRALDNPNELSAETEGNYAWQAGRTVSIAGGALYVTRKERSMIREAAGRPAVITIAGDTGLLDPVWTETVE